MFPTVSSLVNWGRQNLWFLILALAVLLFFVLRTSPTKDVDSLQTLDAALNTGQPVVLEFYSNL